MGKKMKKARLLQIGVVYFLYFFISIAVHEYSHLMCTDAVGYSGHIKSSELNAMYYDRPYPPVKTRAVIGFAGGGGAALVFFVLYLMDVDPENHHAFKMIIGYHLIYACFEAYGSYMLQPWYFMVGSGVSSVFVGVYLIYHILRGWITPAI